MVVVHSEGEGRASPQQKVQGGGVPGLVGRGIRYLLVDWDLGLGRGGEAMRRGGGSQGGPEACSGRGITPRVQVSAHV